MSELVTLPLIVDILRPDGAVRCSNVELSASRYVTNGNIAIEATCTETSCMVNGNGLAPGELGCAGEPWGVLTTNTSKLFGDNYILVKDYSEGEGNLKTLLEAGIVIEPDKDSWVELGFAKAPLCKLTPKGKAFVAASLKARKPDDGEGLA